MDNDIRQELELLLDMTAHPGWAVLVRAMEQELDQFRSGSPFNMKNIEELYFARGVTATIMSLINKRDQIQAQLDELGEG